MNKLLKYSGLTLVLVCFLNLSATAQLAVFNTYSPVSKTELHNLNLRFEGSFFFQNNEYFNSFVEGSTGIGVYAKPTLEYYFMPNLRVNAGVFALKYAGRNKISQLTPIFSIQYEPIPQLDIILGSIYASMNHQLAEPLFRYERFYTHPVEYGMQFLLHTEKVKSDVWLDWEHYIMPGDTASERLTVGTNTRVSLFSGKNWSLTLPFQWLIIHSGGQLEPGPHYISTLMNGLTGLTYKHTIGTHASLQLEQQYALYYGKEFPAEGLPKHQPFKNGFGSYTKIRFNYKSFSLMTGYWYANRFIAPKGSYLFQSVSGYDPAFTEPVRKLWTSKIWFHKNINNKLKLEARFSTYYDMTRKNMDYAYSFYLIINQDVFLTKSKH